MQSGEKKLYNSLHKHISDIADCHIMCFPNSLSVKLGKAYVKKTFEWFLVEEKRFLFHVQLPNDSIIGYCGGFVPKGLGDGSSSGMLQYAFKEAFWGLCKKPWLLFHAEVRPMYPFLYKNIKKRFLDPKKQTIITQTEHSDRTEYAGLVVIGVHPNHQGTGVYQQLMSEFIAECERRQLRGGMLSVKKNNKRGIAAYTKMNWKIVEDHEKSYVLKLTL
jgi:ribosomal protein S18 acetylase RimI-like enzyme